MPIFSSTVASISRHQTNIHSYILNIYHVSTLYQNFLLENEQAVKEAISW